LPAIPACGAAAAIEPGEPILEDVFTALTRAADPVQPES
jgi:hypothetical protein